MSTEAPPRFLTPEDIDRTQVPGPAGINPNLVDEEPRKSSRDSFEKAKKLTDRLAADDYKAGVIAKGMTRLYTMGGMAAMPFFPNSAGAVLSQADDLGQLYEEWAKSDPAVRAKLLKIIRGSAGGKVLLAHLGIAFALFAEIQEKRAAKAEESSFAEEVSNAFGGLSGEASKRAESTGPRGNDGRAYKVPSHAVV